MAAEPDALDELRFLSAALRAHAEWQVATGAFGLPAAPPGSVPALAPPDEPRAVARRAPEGPRSDVRAAGERAALPIAPPAVASAQVTPLEAAERRARLEALAEQIKGCMRCGLHARRKQTVFARGTGSSGLCFVGEGPGADEDAQGLPFVGNAGQLLDRMIAAMGFGRDEVYVCNVVKCRPPDNRKPDPDEMSACMPYLAEQIELVQPQVIVALGATAVQGLLGTTEGITRLRGRFKLYRGKIAVMPTFHPAYLLRNPAAKREVWEDLKAVLRQMNRPIPETR